MLLVFVIFFSCNLYAQKDSVENVHLFSKKEPDLITQVARIQAAAHMHTRRIIMTEDDELSTDAMLACTCCAGVMGNILVDYAIPASWDYHLGNDIRLGSTVCGTICTISTKHLLEAPAIARTINRTYKALIGKTD